MNIKKLQWWQGSAASDSDANLFFARRAAASDPVPASDKPYWTNLFIALKSTMGIDGVTSIFNSLDVLSIKPVYSKATSVANIINANYQGTIVNDFGGSFTAYLGLKGDGAAFRVDWNYNPGDGGGPYKNVLNSSCVGVLCLSDENGDLFDISHLNTTGASGTFIRPRRSTVNQNDFDGYINGSTVTNPITNPYAYGWVDLRKAATTQAEFYVNGMLIKSVSGLVDNLSNSAFKEFAAFTTVYSGWSSKYHGAWYAGNSNIKPTILHGLIYKYLLKPLGVAQARVGKRILCIGDSMTGDPTLTTLSVVSEYPRRISTNLNTVPNGYIVAQNGIANRTLATINGTLATDVVPFRTANYDKDIIVLFAGTNDMASATPTAAAMKALYDTFISTLSPLGFTIVIVGTIDRDSTFTGGQTQGGFDTVRGQLRTLHLAQFSTSTSATNVYTDGTSYYIDSPSNSKFSNAADTTYYNIDGIHLNVTGYDALADELIVPCLQLI